MRLFKASSFKPRKMSLPFPISGRYLLRKTENPDCFLPALSEDQPSDCKNPLACTGNVSKSPVIHATQHVGTWTETGQWSNLCILLHACCASNTDRITFMFFNALTAVGLQ